MCMDDFKPKITNNQSFLLNRDEWLKEKVVRKKGYGLKKN